MKPIISGKSAISNKLAVSGKPNCYEKGKFGKPKVYVIKGLGIGCHTEAAHAYEKAGADVEIVHIRQLLAGGREFLFRSQVLNLSGGFLHGDILGAGMCAANELEQSGIKDLLIEYANKGNVIYGQCNGFQLLVKTGLLPGINRDYSKQTVTLTHNDCGNYRVAPVAHMVDGSYNHFAFSGLRDMFYLWCRHGEGKIQFHSKSGLIDEKQAESNRLITNYGYVILRYVDTNTRKPTEQFPYNPNGSAHGIAGLANTNGNIFGHMAHTEVGVYRSRDSRFFEWKEMLRRQSVKAEDITQEKLEDVCLRVFKNIVNYVR